MKQGSNKSSGYIISLSILLLIITPISSAQNENVISIGDAALDSGYNVTLPVMITNATGVAAVGIKLSYSPGVVNVTSATKGDFPSFFGFDSSNASNGWVTINTFIIDAQLTGNLTIGNVTLEAIGNPGEQSLLNLEIIAIGNKTGLDLPASTDNGSFRINAQTPATTPPHGSEGGGGGGGGGGVSGENFSNIEIKEKHDRFINKGITTSYVFKSTDPIISVNITANISAGDINVAVEVLRNTSSLVKSPAPDTVYKNANIWVGTYGFATPTNIKHAEITFRVPISWMKSNGIDPDSITMMHYQGEWASLPTKKISETSESIYYEASTTRFSPHAITGKKSHSGSFNLVPQTTAIAESQQIEKQVSTGGNEADSPGNLSKYLIIGILMGIILNAALIYWQKKKENEIPN